ncbi:MAG: acyl-CoA dehydrogenase family protein [Myxococcota bacterium]|nr:acyl-CoA dehydrogenase family protein [Myxococcota bacterium]
MDLSYGPEYDDYRKQVQSFLAANWPLTGADAELGLREQAMVFRKRAIASGYLGRNIPKAYGGSEQPLDVLQAQILREEFTKVRAPMEQPGIGTMMLVPTLLERGEEWMKEKWVESSILGETLWCQGYSEPGSGSDLASLQTRGELVGDEWVINGQKIWTSSAQNADFMFALIRTEPDAGKHAGISYLLIDMKQPGIEVRPLKMMSGAADFNEVFFNDVRTPKDWIVGKRGEGWTVSRTTLKHERNSIGNAAQVKLQFDALVRLAKDTGRIHDPGVQQTLGEIEGYVLAHQYTGYRQLSADTHGKSVGVVQMMNKLHSTNIGHQFAAAALEFIGDDSLLSAGTRLAGRAPHDHSAWVGQYMWSLGVAVAGGTANIQRNVIAERGLGLPRDAAADRSASK